jgi:hypothetical protein
MIEIDIDPVVLTRLKADFPKAKSAEKALSKYKALLAQQISNSISAGRSTKGFHVVSIKKIRSSSQLGAAKLRLQNWLENNDFHLFKVVERGSNFSNKLSVIKLTHLAKIRHLTTGAATTDLGDELKQKANNIALVEQLDLSESELAQFDRVPVDMVSLGYYMHWLKHDSRLIKATKKAQYLEQADRIMRVAQVFEGDYLQKRKQSAFGRTYYEGISVQNVNKELRRAMLGNCFELDLKGSAFAWKMGFTADVCALLGTEVRHEFAQTLCYLEDKRDFFLSIRAEMFDRSSNLSRDQQNKLIKGLLQAIGFGARDKSGSWFSDGEWHSGAIREILKDYPTEYERFKRSSIFTKFIDEQDLLDTFIYQSCVNRGDALLKLDAVRTGRGISKAKVMAYLYQHAETAVMDVVQAAIEATGRTVMARVHDAVFIDRRLGEHMDSVTQAMQQATGNQYFRLATTELKAWGRPASLLRSDRIAEAEEERAERDALLKFVSQRAALAA